MTKIEFSVGTSEWLLHASIEELQKALEQEQITSVWLVEQFLQRIAQMNRQGPKINAVLELNPDALFIAQALDRERAKTGSRGMLHGIPVLLKDNVDTGDKMHTSAGSIALATSFARKDSFIARQLRSEGAVLLGKANMTEWANFMTENMPNGYSSRGGQVLNPYGPGRLDTGGSSSGSAAGVAAGFAAAAIGTETSGSILSPASANSLVGIKPTVGLVSRTGIIPIAYSQDTAGPMARTVTDAAIVLGALTGVDEADSATLANPDKAYHDYVSFLQSDSLKTARIGVPQGRFIDGLSPALLQVFSRAIEELRELGAEVIELEDEFQDYDAEDINVLLYEFKSALNHYLDGVCPNVPVHSLADVIAYNRRHEDEALKYDQTLLIASDQTSGTLTEVQYLQSRLKDVRGSRDSGIDRAMNTHELKALLFVNNYGAGIAAKAGYPSVTVPAGYTESGEPLGITLTGRAYSEPTLLALAYAYEQATHHRVNPVF